MLVARNIFAVHDEKADKKVDGRSTFTHSKLKRFFDVGIATGALFILSPLFVIIALAIWLEDRGPIFFVQSRTGLGRSLFKMFKFRSMRPQADNPGFRQAQRNDERITRVGAVIRRTSLDELPQLINVIRGEMSIIGPRPHPPALDAEYADKIANYWERYAVKPGLTGLAQVKGARGETPNVSAMKRRVRYDLVYIRTSSMKTDIEVIFLTFIEVFRSDVAF